MNQIEQNIINSFRLVKNDILKTKEDLLEISKVQKSMLERIAELEKKLESKNENCPPKKRTMKTYVAAKTGKKFHITDCPFAKNIKPKFKVSFKSRTKALNEGYKACRCVQ